MTDEPREPRVEWNRRTDFAEEAEALGIDSDLVIAATQRPYGLLVMWTRSGSPDETIMGTVLTRGADGVYVKGREGPTDTTIGEWMERIRRDLKRRGFGR